MGKLVAALWEHIECLTNIAGHVQKELSTINRLLHVLVHAKMTQFTHILLKHAFARSEPI